MTNNTENLVLDISSPQQQLVSYGGKQQIGFYDGYKAGESVLYIYIKNNGDRFTEVRRRAGSRKVPGPIDMQLVEEVKLYARAYAKYLDIKSNGGLIDPEKRVMRAKIAELEAKAEVEAKEAKALILEAKKEVKEVKEEKSAKDLKVALDAKGVEYKGNASKEALQELLANSK